MLGEACSFIDMVQHLLNGLKNIFSFPYGALLRKIPSLHSIYTEGERLGVLIIDEEIL